MGQKVEESVYVTSLKSFCLLRWSSETWIFIILTSIKQSGFLIIYLSLSLWQVTVNWPVCQPVALLQWRCPVLLPPEELQLLQVSGSPAHLVFLYATSPGYRSRCGSVRCLYNPLLCSVAYCFSFCPFSAAAEEKKEEKKEESEESDDDMGFGLFD